MQVKRIGIDLAKNVFQLHGINEHGKTVLRKRLTRNQFTAFIAQQPATTLAMEACGSAHHWGRTFVRLGHEVKLIAPQFVTPYRKKQKNDANDAEAICEAAGRPAMRFVALKSEEQQALLMLHRARQSLVTERTTTANQIRGMLTEYGIVFNQGISQLRRGIPKLLDADNSALPVLAREVITERYEYFLFLDKRINRYERQLKNLAEQTATAKRAMQLEGIGPITATALAAMVTDARQFDSGRNFAAWLGLVPRQYSSGNQVRLGRITKRGDSYLRTLLVHGARSALLRSRDRKDAKSRWACGVWERRGFNKAIVALAAKHARILWAMLAKDEDYHLKPAI